MNADRKDAVASVATLLDALFSPAELDADPFAVQALGDILRPLVARHAAAWRRMHTKQRPPDPNGGPPEGGTPTAAKEAA